MNLISKRELLENTGISYGQLYRWKREGLIPEEWFIKRASFTGQETFLPREQALARIGAILSLKDDYSLVQIKQMLSGVNSNISQEDMEKIEELYGEAADQEAKHQAKSKKAQEPEKKEEDSDIGKELMVKVVTKKFFCQ